MVYFAQKCLHVGEASEAQVVVYKGRNPGAEIIASCIAPIENSGGVTRARTADPLIKVVIPIRNRHVHCE